MNGPRTAMWLLVAGTMLGGGGMMLSAFSGDWPWSAAFLGLTAACVVLAVHCVRMGGVDDEEEEETEEAQEEPREMIGA